MSDVKPILFYSTYNTYNYRASTLATLGCDCNAKISNVTIIALLCWQVSLGLTNQCAFYRLLVGLGMTGLPERSHFNRRCTAMVCLLQTLRVVLVKHCLPSVTYTIIDNFPIPLCQSIRNHQAKILRSIADIGYNTTKNGSMV